MTGIIAYAAIAYLAVQFGVVLANLITWPVLNRRGNHSDSSLSVLIPARNEAQNIGNLLDDLRITKDNVIEILVYDDDSSDETADIIKAKSIEDSRIRCMKGDGPQAGWLGKNHACHEMASAANGDFLLFLDADVRVDKELIVDSISYAEEHRLDLLSIFPVQEMKSLGEWLTVPLMNKILVGNLPLILIRETKWKDIAAANGQFMLFRSEIYRRHRFHEMVKEERVEDIRIIKMMKMFGHRAQTLLSGGQVRCRMYRGYDDALNGFAKNVNAFFGNNWLILILYVMLTTLGPFAVWSVFSVWAMLIYLAVLISTRIMISVLSRQDWLMNILLMPLQQATLAILSAKAAWQQISGKMEWKGRRV